MTRSEYSAATILLPSCCVRARSFVVAIMQVSMMARPLPVPPPRTGFSLP